MAKYRITAPDGNSYVVTAPDDATEDQVLAYAQQNYTMAGKPKPARLSKPTGPKAEGDDFLARTKDQYGRYWAGVGKSMVDTGRGVRQYAVDALADPTNVAGPLGRPILRAAIGKQVDALAQNSPALQGVRQYADRLRKEEAERRELLPSFSEDPVFATGNIMGTLGQIVGPGVAARGTIAARALLPRTVGGNALQGGVVGTLQPVAEAGERGWNTVKGTAAGWAGAAVPKVMGAVARPFVRALRGVSSTDMNAAARLQGEATNPEALLRPQPSVVPGVRRTLGEESLDPGTMALENTLRAQNRGAFEPIDRANNLARVSQLENIAGTEGDMAAALQTRSLAAQQARDQAMQSGPIDIAQTLAALDEAIAGQQGRPAVQGGLKQLRGLLVRQADEGQEAVPEDRIPVLDNVRQTIGDMLGGKYGGENAAALQGSRELIGIRDTLNQNIGDQAPAFTDYLSAYRSGSAPINRMEVGRELINKASSAVPDETGVRPLLPAQFSRQMNDLDQTAARATGFDKARADDILSRDDMNLLRSIQDDMSRQFRRQSSATVGSQTAERGAIAKRIGVRTAARAIPLVKDAADYFEQKASERLNERLSYLVANPNEARRVLQAMNKEDRAILSKALFNLSARTGVSVPALAE